MAMRPLALLLFTLAAGSAQAQAARVTEADIHAFAARQEQAWNAGDLDRYFAGFTADARFTDQAYVGDKPPVPYGTSTLAEAKAQARRAAGKSRERGEIRRIEIAPDGRSARVTSRVGSTVEASGKPPRRLCASRLQTLVMSGGGLRASGQTDTFVKCSSR
jgi:hypothetical protein